MKLADLSQNDQMLVQTEFPAQLEKEAAAEAQLVNELYSTGFSKLASETIEMIEKGAEEAEAEGDSDDDDDDDKEDYKEKMDEGEKKEAAARGAFIARGYIDGLMKEGQAKANDPYHYVYDLLAEKVAHDPNMSEQEKIAAAEFLGHLKVGNVKLKMLGGAIRDAAQTMGNKAVAAGKDVGSKAMKRYKDIGRDAQIAATGSAKSRFGGKMVPQGKKTRAKAGLRALGKMTPELAAAGGAGYMMSGKKK
jgi:hypothetical protein